MASLWSCAELSSRPAELPYSRFEPWVPDTHPQRKRQIKALLSLVDLHMDQTQVAGVDLFSTQPA